MHANALGFQGVNYYQGVAEKWSPDPTKYALAGILPMVSYPTEMIKWDILAGIQGMTQAAALDAPAPLINHRKIREMSEVTRYWREGGRVRLQPENSALEPIYAEHVQVLGKVVGVFRSLR